MLRLVIVDDEAPARANLRAALGSIPLDVEVVGEAHDVESAVALLEKEHPDVVLHYVNACKEVEQMISRAGFKI